MVVSALKEAFDRDHQRLELERQRLEEERERAERLLRLEWLRQAGEREIARLRVLAGVALAGWLGTLFLVGRADGERHVRPRDARVDVVVPARGAGDGVFRTVTGGGGAWADG